MCQNESNWNKFVFLMATGKGDPKRKSKSPLCNPFAKEAKEPVEETDSQEEMEQEELEEPNDGSEIEEADDDVY